MNSHDIIILFVIITIVVIQVSVFFSSIKKIYILKSIFPKVFYFKTVKVLIPEDKINSIKPEEVFRNLNRTSGIVELKDGESIHEPNHKSSIKKEKHINSHRFYYKGTPTPGGIFKFEYSLFDLQEGVLYEFNEVDDGIASFSYVGDEKVTSAVLNDLKLFIQPVCNIEHYSDSPETIEHLYDGFAKKVDVLTWQMIEKAKVKLV